MDNKKAFITGHRPDKLFGYNMNDEKYAIIKEWIKGQLIEHNIDELYCGLALGIDIVGAKAVLELKESGVDIKLHACIPFNNYHKKWNTEDVKIYNSIIESADIVDIVTDAEWEDGCTYLLDRNHFMVDACIMGFGIINNKLKPAVLNKTGTMECIKYAKKKHVECVIFDANTLNEADKTEEENKSQEGESKTKSTKKKPNIITLEALDLWNSMDTFIVMDLETTGYSFKAGSRIIDIGAYEVNGNVLTTKYEQLINPGCSIPDNIVKLTGINDLMVQRKPTIFQVINTLIQYVGNKPVVFHNAKFDYGQFIEPMCKSLFSYNPNWDVLCTLELARMIVKSDKKDLPTLYKLMTGKEASNQSHRASADALMTVEVAAIMQRYIRQNYTKLREELEIKLGMK